MYRGQRINYIEFFLSTHPMGPGISDPQHLHSLSLFIGTKPEILHPGPPEYRMRGVSYYPRTTLLSLDLCLIFNYLIFEAGSCYKIQAQNPPASAF